MHGEECGLPWLKLVEVTRSLLLMAGRSAERHTTTGSNPARDHRPHGVREQRQRPAPVPLAPLPVAHCASPRLHEVLDARR